MPAQNKHHDAARLALVAQRLDSVNILFGTLMSGGPCDLVDEKVFEGASTPEGDLCRIRARFVYILAVLDCEFGPNPTPTCCEDAAQAYCDTWEACPA